MLKTWPAKNVWNFKWGKKCEGKRQLGRLKRLWGIILKWIVKTSYGDVDWINVARDKAQRQGLVSVITEVRFR